MTDTPDRRRFGLGLIAIALMAVAGEPAEAARRKKARTRKPRSRAAGSAAPSGGFRSCREAHAAGRYGIRAGDDDYSRRLDRDGDGRACE